MSRFDLNQNVNWHGNIGKIVGLTTEPSAIVEFPNGENITVGLSTLTPINMSELALPVAENTVIRVTWQPQGEYRPDWDGWHGTTDYILTEDQTWKPIYDNLAPAYLAWRFILDITSFEVMSEPPERTMEHVLSQAGGLLTPTEHKYLRHELGLPEYPVNET